MQFIQQRPDEVRLNVLKASLQYSAAIRMGCELVYVILECRDEERPVRERAFQLAHVVAVSVFHTLKYVPVQLGDPADLFLGAEKVNHLPGEESIQT
jgi:hypothetical protein